MSTRNTLRFQQNEGELPGWRVYEELFEKEEVVYLEIEGVQADVTMIGGLWGTNAGTALLRIPTAIARQLGLVPPGWAKDNKWSEGASEEEP
ncbi:MAG TPA: hypothetical protein VJU59_11605 [Paraburkholderia sp.]|uniref:hypothetical protein n=1 Tax=Paraburkholderia sp. TaxID=1926495 RepID=UPI002B4A8FA9|nr:hypothetical protein [Paraburkholderia sp.]HKR40304.1 hypothetical protein [Paraburkholderia sp.]